MNKYIGIIVAEHEELYAIKEIMNNIEELHIFNLTLYKGIISNKTYILVRGGVGKVNAARTTQILIDKFDIEYIINLGSAGGLNENLHIGDIVIGEKLIQHDFDVTAFGREKGFIPETGKYFESNSNLLANFENIHLDDVKIIKGVIASGDIFCTSRDLKENIQKEFNADCVEMEGAAVAQVCYLNNIPFIILRSISDIPNGENYIDFNEYLKLASKNCARILKEL